MAPKYRFFHIASHYAIWVGNNEVGQYFNFNGVFWGDLVTSYRYEMFQNFYEKTSVEISLSEVLKLLDNETARKIVLLTLGIKKGKPVELTETTISDIISLLKQNHAFNGDSAFEVKDEKILKICGAMKEKGLINESPLNDSMFYLKI